MLLLEHWMDTAVPILLHSLLVDRRKSLLPHETHRNVKEVNGFIRRLQSADWVMTTVAPASGFYFYQTMQQMKAKCRVDLEEIGSRLSVQLLGKDGLLQLPAGDDEQTPAELVSLWNPVMEALAPAGELECNNTQHKQFHDAMDNFQKCAWFRQPPNANTTSSSFSAKNNNVMTTSELIQDLGSHCHVSSLLSNTANCTDALLSDNRTLYTLQDMYQHTDKYCKCSSILQQELPSCFVTVADIIHDDTTSSFRSVTTSTSTAKNPLYQKMKFSLGFVKSTLLCAADLGCDAMNRWCVRQINELDRCLRTNPGCTSGNKNSNLSSVCAQNDIFALPSQLTQGKLPDVCLNTFKSHRHLNASVVDEFSNYFQTCQSQDWLLAMKDDNLGSSAPHSSHSTNPVVVTAILVGVIILASIGVWKTSCLRRQRHNHKRRFRPDEVGEQEELREFGLESVS